MTDFTDAIGEGLDDALTECGETFTLRGVARTGIINALGTEADWIAGGDRMRRRCSILFKIPTPDFSAPALRNGEHLTARSAALKIESIEKDEASYTLQCVDATA